MSLIVRNAYCIATQAVVSAFAEDPHPNGVALTSAVSLPIDRSDLSSPQNFHSSPQLDLGTLGVYILLFLILAIVASMQADLEELANSVKHRLETSSGQHPNLRTVPIAVLSTALPTDLLQPEFQQEIGNRKNERAIRFNHDFFYTSTSLNELSESLTDMSREFTDTTEFGKNWRVRAETLNAGPDLDITQKTFGATPKSSPSSASESPRSNNTTPHDTPESKTTANDSPRLKQPIANQAKELSLADRGFTMDDGHWLYRFIPMSETTGPAQRDSARYSTSDDEMRAQINLQSMACDIERAFLYSLDKTTDDLSRDYWREWKFLNSWISFNTLRSELYFNPKWTKKDRVMILFLHARQKRRDDYSVQQWTKPFVNSQPIHYSWYDYKVHENENERLKAKTKWQPRYLQEQKWHADQMDMADDAESASQELTNAMRDNPYPFSRNGFDPTLSEDPLNRPPVGPSASSFARRRDETSTGGPSQRYKPPHRRSNLQTSSGSTASLRDISSYNRDNPYIDLPPHPRHPQHHPHCRFSYSNRSNSSSGGCHPDCEVSASTNSTVKNSTTFGGTDGTASLNIDEEAEMASFHTSKGKGKARAGGSDLSATATASTSGSGIFNAAPKRKTTVDLPRNRKARRSTEDPIKVYDDGGVNHEDQDGVNDYDENGFNGNANNNDSDKENDNDEENEDENGDGNSNLTDQADEKKEQASRDVPCLWASGFGLDCQVL